MCFGRERSLDRSVTMYARSRIQSPRRRCDWDVRGFTLLRVCRLESQERTDRDPVHVRSEKTINRLCRRVHDRLVLVERGVDENRHSADLAETLQKLPVERADVPLDRLETPGAIGMGHSRNALTLLGLDL